MHERTKFFLLDGKPIFDDTYFEPPLDFADGETPLHCGPTHALPAKRRAGAGSTSSQHHHCPVCLTPVPTAALGQGALAARESLTGGEARAEASADSRQQEHQSHGMKLKHLVAILANAMVCLLQSLSTDDPGEEVMHRCVLPPYTLRCIYPCQLGAVVGDSGVKLAWMSSCSRGAQAMVRPALLGRR